jgi:hypothetical protein
MYFVAYIFLSLIASPLIHNFKKMKKLFPVIIITLLLFSCKKENNTSPLHLGSASDLTGTKWQIYQYKDQTSSNPQTRNDTLIFTDATNYKYNNTNYTYYLNIGDYTHLTLHSTPFGDIDGTVPNNFIQNGEILAVPFSQVQASGALTYNLWMKKI